MVWKRVNNPYLRGRRNLNVVKDAVCHPIADHTTWESPVPYLLPMLRHLINKYSSEDIDHVNAHFYVVLGPKSSFTWLKELKCPPRPTNPSARSVIRSGAVRSAARSTTLPTISASRYPDPSASAVSFVGKCPAKLAKRSASTSWTPPDSSSCPSWRKRLVVVRQPFQQRIIFPSCSPKWPLSRTRLY